MNIDSFQITSETNSSFNLGGGTTYSSCNSFSFATNTDINMESIDITTYGIGLYNPINTNVDIASSWSILDKLNLFQDYVY